MKKILFFIDTLGHGGAEKVLVNLVNNLDKSKYKITLMTIFDSGVNKQYLNKNIEYRYIFKRAFRGNVMLFRLFKPSFLYRLFIKDKYDIVVSYLEGNTTRILSGCPYRDTKKLAWLHVEMNEKTLFYPWGNKEKCISGYEKFDKIIGVSQTVIDSFVENTKEWNNLQVMYNTVDTDAIKNKSMEKIDDVEYASDIINVISVGRLIDQKGYDKLLRIHKRLLDNGIVHNLYILGEGHKRSELERYIKDNKLQNSAYLLGFKDNPWKYVAKADLFVCSSLQEGFSTAVSEALIVGTPVVTTLCSGMKEMLGESEYGLITDNDEDSLYRGIYKMLTDKNLLEYYKTKAIERGKFFDKKNTVSAVEDMLDNM